ncbi:DotH/IcmK family type IV secretion protein [Klebsiella aerogenes]
MKLTTTATLLAFLSAPACAAGWAQASTASHPVTSLPPAPANVNAGQISVSGPGGATQSPPTGTPVAAAPETSAPAAAEITAGMVNTPPPPPSSSEAYAIGQAAPLDKDDIKTLKSRIDDEKRGKAWEPVDTVPRISTLTISLSPGASLPVLRTAVNEPSSVVFTDNTGAPWPLAAPPYNGNENGFKVTFIPDSSVMVVQARRQYDRGNITVYLKGLPVPVIVDVNSGEPDSSSTSQVIDSRLDLRLPQRGPQAKRLPAGDSKVGLYNDTLQAFLDGIPPKDARRLKTQGNVPATEVWQLGDDLYIRTHSELRDSFEQTLSAGDGTTLYKLPLTPQAAFSVAGKTVYLTISLE